VDPGWEWVRLGVARYVLMAPRRGKRHARHGTRVGLGKQEGRFSRRGARELTVSFRVAGGRAKGDRGGLVTKKESKPGRREVIVFY